MSKPTPTSLLAWSVANQTDPQTNDSPAHPPPNISQIDPKWIEVILGKPDSARMKELVTNISESKDLDTRIASFDELEMLLESLDNSNDLQPLNLWKPLIELLKDEEAQIRMYSAWTMGTAVQNNEKSQDAFERSGGIDAILSCLATETDDSVINKGLYCVSSAIRSNQRNLEKFLISDGIKFISNVCKNGNENMGRRVMFLINALITESCDSDFAAIFGQLQKVEFTSLVMGYLDNHGVDEELIEQIVSLLASLQLRSKLIFESNLLVPVLQKLHSRIQSSELKSAILDLSNKLE